MVTKIGNVDFCGDCAADDISDAFLHDVKEQAYKIAGREKWEPLDPKVVAAAVLNTYHKWEGATSPRENSV